MYGKNVPDRGDGKRRISCPYCQQKYVITDVPYHGLIGCQVCLNIFSAPKPFLLRIPDEKIDTKHPVFRGKPAPAPDVPSASKLNILHTPEPGAPTLADSEDIQNSASFISIKKPDAMGSEDESDRDPFAV